MSAAAAAAWRSSGGEKHVDLGARVCAVRLKFIDTATRKSIWLFQVSAYAPIGCAKPEEHDAYLECLDRCIARKRPGDLLVIGTDANASLGKSEARDDARGSQSVGPFGEPHVNDAGIRFRSYLETRGLTAATTHFKKRNYATWKHPCSGKLHQVDHFLVESNMMRHVSDCGITDPLVDSDHRAVKIVLRVVPRVQKKAVTSRAQLCKLDFSVLRGRGEDADVIRTEFCHAVMSEYELPSESAGYSRFADAVFKVSLRKMPRRKRASPGWFEQSKEVLIPLIAERNSAMANVISSRHRTRSVATPLSNARKRLRIAIAKAKSDWIMHFVGVVNAGNARGGSKASWEAVKVLRAGLSKTKKSVNTAMKKASGELASSPEENATVFEDHFKQLYGRLPDGDPAVVDSIPEMQTAWHLGDMPGAGEIEAAVKKLHNTAPGKSGLPAAAWKAMLQTEETRELVFEIVRDIWENEKQPDEFAVGVLAILPKKGDLSEPGNYRGIMMLEVAYKIVAIITADRCYWLSENQVDHENQVGFRPGRGCSDATFSVRAAIKKRSEHGLETWAFFLDLVKAFDRVPRAMLWAVIEKFGAPPKLIAVLKALHASVLVEFEVDGVSRTIESIIGVKQGDVLGPVLFVLYMAAVMISWRLKHTDKAKLCVFHSRDDAVMAGRASSSGRASEEFVLQDSEYADDTGLFYCEREEVEASLPLVYDHFIAWGMEVHSGRVDKASKSEVLFCAAHRATYLNYSTFTRLCGRSADLSPIQLGGGRLVPVVLRFKYLGSLLSADCRDEADVLSRVKSAGAAFGALGSCLFRAKDVVLAAKRTVYNGLVLAILLYGCESWALTEKMLGYLRVFHATCVRAMNNVSMTHVWRFRISTAELERRLGLQPIDVYLYRRQLAWAGHVARMEWGLRMPRKLLTCWVKHDANGNGKRPRAGQMMSYWRSLKKALDRAGVGTDSPREWMELAQNREEWRLIILNIT